LQQPQHLLALTSLRFFAAAAIVVYHMQGLLLPAIPLPLGLGVSFFYVLSGFILTYVYRDMSGHSIKRYYLTRIARLWPMHLATLVLAMPLLPAEQGVSYPLSLLANAFLVHSWIPIWGYPFSFNAVSWSLSVEVSFYILFPPLAMTKHFRWWYLGFGALVIMALLLVAPHGLANPEVAGELSVRAFVTQSPLIRILEFATGVAAGRLFLTRKIPCGLGAELAVLCALLAYTATVYDVRALIGGVFGQWYSQAGGQFIFAAVIFVFASSTGPITRALSNRVLASLGEVSFATYMVHQIVILVLVNSGAYLWLGRLAAPIVTLLAIYGLSYLLWWFVELKGRRLMTMLLTSPPAIMDPAKSRNIVRSDSAGGDDNPETQLTRGI
jgi:peptidoglycan/LPS O-acetylase OafA/YrhL